MDVFGASRYINPRWVDENRLHIIVDDTETGGQLTVAVDPEDPIYKEITEGNPETGSLPQDIADMTFGETQAEAKNAVTEYCKFLREQPLMIGGRAYAMHVEARNALNGASVQAASLRKSGQRQRFFLEVVPPQTLPIEVDDVILLHRVVVERDQKIAALRIQALRAIDSARTLHDIEIAVTRVTATEI